MWNNDFPHVTPEDLIRFLTHVDKQATEPHCWDWSGPSHIEINGIVMRPKRASWFIYVGTDTDWPGSWVTGCHYFNKKCVNPEHLRQMGPGEALVNNTQQVDRTAPKPSIAGSQNPRAKLTDEQVQEIMESFKSISKGEIAIKFGISLSHVYRLANGRRSQPSGERKRKK